MPKTSREMLNAFPEHRKYDGDKRKNEVNAETCLLLIGKVLGNPPAQLKDSTLEFRRAFAYLGSLITSRDHPLKSKGAGNQQEELEERGFNLYKVWKPKGSDSNFNSNCPQTREFLDLIGLEKPNIHLN